ncbi:MAG: hypothetical protein R3E86_14420 [Pseudomonadales bacterium]
MRQVFCTMMIAALAALAGVARAEIANPADNQAGPELNREQGQRTTSAYVESIVVKGERSPYHEEELIGEYRQPRWTAFRRFPTTRVYVRPKGYVGVEQWYRVEDRRDGKTSTTAQTEIEFGLPHRLQLDLYLISRKEGASGETFVDNAVEVRYAFADWGEIWGNPTLYVEYVSQDSEANKVETKLLLGDELVPGWHWGTNLVWEYTLGGARTREYELAMGVSHTLSDDRFSLGLETKLAVEDEKGSRGDWDEDLRLGPSIQWRPLPQMHIDVAPLFGLTHDSKRADIFAVFGWEF